MQVTVRDLMTSQPLTVSKLATVEEATRMILDRAANELYVVDETDRLQGVVSDFSLLKSRMVSSDSQEPVTCVMSRDMKLLNPDMQLDEVSGFFRESCCSRLAVVEDGQVVGQLSRRDVLRAMTVISGLDSETTPATPAFPPLNAGNRIHRLESPEMPSLREATSLRSAPRASLDNAGDRISPVVTR